MDSKNKQLILGAPAVVLVRFLSSVKEIEIRGHQPLAAGSEPVIDCLEDQIQQRGLLDRNMNHAPDEFDNQIWSTTLLGCYFAYVSMNLVSLGASAIGTCVEHAMMT